MVKREKILRLPRRAKQCIALVVDVVMSIAATWAAFSLRLDMWHIPVGYQHYVYILSGILFLPLFVRLGLYHAIFRYTGFSVMATIAKASAAYGILFFLILFWLRFPDVPRSVGLLQPLLFLILTSSSRILARFWLTGISGHGGRGGRQGRLLIYGAGHAGIQFARALDQTQEFLLVGFVDDKRELQGKIINGQRVYAPQEIGGVVARCAVTDILLAIPSASRGRRKEILEALSFHQLHVRSLPGLMDLAQGKVTISDIRELDIEDLLGRNPVPPDVALMGQALTNKVVLVTGAGGSIGSELCRQILSFNPSVLLLLESHEFSLYTIHAELEMLCAAENLQTKLFPLLGNVCHRGRLREIYQAWHPNIVYHAAAYKHVPLVEYNPSEGIYNNVFGTLMAAQVAVEEKVQDFVLISTDKAVRPPNIMGASKRLAEMVLQALAGEDSPAFEGAPCPNATRFSMVRFGNVLDSSGSVVPLFQRQIKRGLPLTITHPEVTRFFMTIPEAAQLVIQAGAMAAGGEVFVLNMGEPVKIVDLARRMVELSGLTVRDADHPNGDIPFEFIGLRPGEKLYEELLIGDNPEETAHPRIMKASEDYLPWETLRQKLQVFSRVLEKNDRARLLTLLGELVKDYKPSEKVVGEMPISGGLSSLQGKEF